MAETSRDNNKVGTMMGVLNTDGTTPTRIKANPTSHALDINDGTSGADIGPDDASRDNSGMTTLMVVSNTDGVTPVLIFIDSNGKILVKST